MLKIGHEVVRPGKTLSEAPITIPVPEELETVAGIPLNLRDVDWYAKEYPLETMNITERASRDWANTLRDGHVEMREIRKEHDKLNRPLIMAARLTGDQEPTVEPTGEDVTAQIYTCTGRRIAVWNQPAEVREMTANDGESFSVDEIVDRFANDVGVEELSLFADLERRMAEMAEKQAATEVSSEST